MKEIEPVSAPIQTDLFAPQGSPQQEKTSTLARRSSAWMCGDRWIETGWPWADQRETGTTLDEDTAPS